MAPTASIIKLPITTFLIKATIPESEFRLKESIISILFPRLNLWLKRIIKTDIIVTTPRPPI